MAAKALYPSHLEAVNPVVLGKARAKQDQNNDDERTSCMPILLHGDAAFAGQGVVAEGFGLSGLKGHKTGGTMHIVVNNQIGFTTAPHFSRSSPYPTDIALMVEAPIFHVNGDDPEAVVHAAKIATEFRQKFHRDVVIDIICYRRFGHNEGDEPMFTNPLMYKKIKKQKTTLTLYTERLVRDGLIPDGFPLHKTIGRLLDAKAEMFKTGAGFDWATGEALAFGSLLTEGYPVRLSGQDCTRGTFSHRHSGLINQDTEERYYPLNNIRAGQSQYEVIDSMLSEYAVLGFEYGYSLAEPNALTLWEAQFGDFANGAQIMFDQFISSGESKWLRMSGLVCLLPHGYEGQGPEHSSARLERFLTMCGGDNWIVANCTTPANYFHILRRQNGNSDTKLKSDDEIKRVVMCSGKVYYDLLEERDARGLDDVYILRFEQFYPFPAISAVKELERFKNAEMVWCQEEPKNQGAWSFIEPNIEWVLTRIKAKHSRPAYAGRSAAASPATGLASQHKAQQAALVDDALTVKGDK